MPGNPQLGGGARGGESRETLRSSGIFFTIFDRKPWIGCSLWKKN